MDIQLLSFGNCKHKEYFWYCLSCTKFIYDYCNCLNIYFYVAAFQKKNYCNNKNNNNNNNDDDDDDDDDNNNNR